MSRKLGIGLVVYSILLVGLSGLTHRLAPSIASPILNTGIVGGVLCFIGGLRAIWGNRSKVWVILTLIPINFMAVAHTILFWAGRSEEVPGIRHVAIVVTGIFFLSIAMLSMIAYAGVLFDRELDSPSMQPTRR